MDHTVLPISMRQGGELAQILEYEGFGGDAMQFTLEHKWTLIKLIRSVAAQMSVSTDKADRQTLWRLIYGAWAESGCEVPLPLTNYQELYDRHARGDELIFIAPLLSTAEGCLASLGGSRRYFSIEQAFNQRLVVYSGHVHNSHCLSETFSKTTMTYGGWVWVSRLGSYPCTSVIALNKVVHSTGKPCGLHVGAYLALNALSLARSGRPFGSAERDIFLPGTSYGASKHSIQYQTVLTGRVQQETSVVLVPMGDDSSASMDLYTVEPLANRS